MAGVGIGGYGVRIVRDAKSLLPDHEVTVGPGTDDREQLQDLLARRQTLITQPASPERDHELKEVSRQLLELGRK